MERFLYDCTARDMDISVYPGGPLSQILVEFYVQDQPKAADYGNGSAPSRGSPSDASRRECPT